LGADLGDRAVPQSALADGKLEHLGRVSGRGEQHEGERQHYPAIPHSASLHAAYPTRYFSIIFASSSSPKPGPAATCIMPSLIGGRFTHIDCHTGSRSGSAKHSTQVPCGTAAIRCCDICDSSWCAIATPAVAASAAARRQSVTPPPSEAS